MRYFIHVFVSVGCALIISFVVAIFLAVAYFSFQNVPKSPSEPSIPFLTPKTTLIPPVTTTPSVP